jgi:hypothetical protein
MHNSSNTWYVTPCTLVKARAEEARNKWNTCLHGLLFYPEDGGNTFLPNVGMFLPDYMS